MQGVYELVIRFEGESLVIEPHGQVDADTKRNVLEWVAAAADVGVAPSVRVDEDVPPVPRPRPGPTRER